jgi:hypothetical protein
MLDIEIGRGVKTIVRQGREDIDAFRYWLLYCHSWRSFSYGFPASLAQMRECTCDQNSLKWHLLSLLILVQMHSDVIHHQVSLSL